MKEEILVNVTPREVRAALVENGVLQEVLYAGLALDFANLLTAEHQSPAGKTNDDGLLGLADDLPLDLVAVFQ